MGHNPDQHIKMAKKMAAGGSIQTITGKLFIIRINLSDNDKIRCL